MPVSVRDGIIAAAVPRLGVRFQSERCLFFLLIRIHTLERRTNQLTNTIKAIQDTGHLRISIAQSECVRFWDPSTATSADVRL